MGLRSVSTVTAPADEPVSVDEAKLFCKVDGTDEDTLIASLVKTARIAAENFTARAFITQTVKLTLDGFCEADDRDDLELIGPITSNSSERKIDLARLPVQSITSIKTTDTANVQSTVAPATYTLSKSSGSVLLNPGYQWPGNLRADAAVEIVSVNGYGDAAADVPEPIKLAILQHVYAMYSDRGCSDIPDGAKALLNPYRSAEAFGAW